MHALIFGCRIRHRSPGAGTSSAYKAWRLPLEVPTFSVRFFDGFSELLSIRIKKIDAAQLSRIVERRFFREPIPAFPSVAAALDIPDQISGHR